MISWRIRPSRSVESVSRTAYLVIFFMIKILARAGVLPCEESDDCLQVPQPIRVGFRVLGCTDDLSVPCVSGVLCNSEDKSLQASCSARCTNTCPCNLDVALLSCILMGPSVPLLGTQRP